jgi:AraC-like DNA-binding protein
MIWDHNVVFRIKLRGTINDNSDTDTGYCLEAAIPWTDFNLRPEPGMAFGFDAVNVDRDAMDKRKFFVSWSRTTWLTNDNPTEWGTLVLEKKKPAIGFRTIALLFLVILIVIMIRIFRKKPEVIPETAAGREKESPKYDPRIHKALEFIESRFHEDISMEHAAEAAGLSKDYFSKLFIKETGKPFSQHLVNFRIDRAKELLGRGQLNITEIAYKTGFPNSQYFSTKFKEIVGQSPKDFKKTA